MLDSFLGEELQGEIFLPEQTPLVKRGFMPYTGFVERVPFENSINHQNMNKRMITFLQRNNTVSIMNYEQKDSEKERCYRHKINERLRREKEKQNYLSLHSLLPSRTKVHKSSIVQSATLQVQELKRVKDELENRNKQLEERLLVREQEQTFPPARLRIHNPSSTLDSTIKVLRCLKSMGLEATTIRSEYSPMEFSTTLQIQTKIEASRVEEAVQRALVEDDNNLL